MNEDHKKFSWEEGKAVTLGQLAEEMGEESQRTWQIDTPRGLVIVHLGLLSQEEFERIQKYERKRGAER